MPKISYGHKAENMMLTRVRVNCSYLKAHSYKTGHSLTTACPFCPNKTESSLHYYNTVSKIFEF